MSFGSLLDTAQHQQNNISNTHQNQMKEEDEHLEDRIQIVRKDQTSIQRQHSNISENLVATSPEAKRRPSEKLQAYANFTSVHNMHFRTYNVETGSNNGACGTSRGAILEEIDEELAALLEDDDLVEKKNKKDYVREVGGTQQEVQDSAKTSNPVQNNNINHLLP